MHQRHPVLQHNVPLILWGTPRAGMSNASNVVTERGIRDLPLQILHERGTTNRYWPVNNEFIEWIMGVPLGLTDVGN